MFSIMHGRRLAVNSILLSKIRDRLTTKVAVASSTSTASTPNASKKNTSTAKDADHFTGLVLGVHERNIEFPKLTISSKVFDQQVSGSLHKLIKDFNLCGSSGTVKLFHNFEADYGAVASALGCDRLQNQNCDEMSIDDMGYPEPVAEGGIWKYQDYFKEEKRSKVSYLDLYQLNEDSREQFISGIIRAEAQKMCFSIKIIIDFEKKILSIVIEFKPTLADTLVYGVKAYKAKNVISIGASSTEIRETFGEAAAPIYKNSDCFLGEMAQAASLSHDRIWKMPNWQYCMLKRNDLQLQFLQKDLMIGHPTRALV